ncbi:hypothetical protein MBLNU459_g7478t1 [Dothideomycetes sp. NU459]
MSTFTLPDSNPECPVHLIEDLSKDQLLDFPAFKTWVSTLQHSLTQQKNQDHTFHAAPYQLRRIQVQHVDKFGGGRIGFIKLAAEVTNDDGEKLPGSVFLRGGSVAMLLILQPDDVPEDSEEDKHVILTVQPRIPAGSLSFAELPAGMLDDAGSFSGGAAKEIQEETGMEVAEDDLVDLTALTFSAGQDPQEEHAEKLQKAMYPSAGGCDEFVPILMHQRRIPRAQLKDWQGKLSGLRDHGEKITLKVVKLEDLWREGGRDSKALSAWAIYEGLRREGKLGKSQSS